MLANLAFPVLLAAISVAPAAPLPPAPACDETTPASLLAMDTAAGNALLAVNGADGKARLLTFDAEAAFVTAEEDRDHHFAGSIGPGPIFALRRCGKGCVAAESFEPNGWEPLGDRLAIPDEANLYATYDRGGRAWILAHRPSRTPGWTEAWAFQLTGPNSVKATWQAQGRLQLTAPPTQGALPAPAQRDAIVSGTARFTAGQAPTTWSSGLPTLPPGKQGQLLPISDTVAAYLAGDGAVYLSTDAGASWKGLRWRPWGVEPTEIWAYGVDYSADLPLGAWGDSLPIAWFDRRPGREPKIFLSELSPAGQWSLLSELATEVTGAGEEKLELVHLLRTAGGTWLFLTDCAVSGGTAGLTLRTWGPAGLTPARFLPLR